MSEPGHKYRAFISYSHADTSWARWLHRALEAFPIDKDLAGRITTTGTIPAAIRPVFRDRDEFTAGHALADQTFAALGDSAALIVICSPASTKSRYVNEEVRLFKTRYPERPLIPLIVDGKPDDPEFECFPPAMKFKLDAKGRVTKKKVELLAADAREEGDGKNLALAKVVAGLVGVSSDEIFRRAERERKVAARRRRRVQVSIAVLTALLVAGGAAWWKENFLREQWYWHVTMAPEVRTPAQERALKPGDEFAECKRDCPEMVVIPAGKFVMGSPEGQGSDIEHPQRRVTIGKPFAVGKFEVTLDEWQRCVDAGACASRDDYSEMPISAVSWDQAHEYVAWLSRVTRRAYRLLSEAEWEYVARAGTTTAYVFGDDVGKLDAYGWYEGNAKGRLHYVGQKEPNHFQIFDMAGNVSEWVEDCLHDSYMDAPNDGASWSGNCRFRVIRGGSWLDEATKLRSAARGFGKADEVYQSTGFRVARTLNR
jgi:formylglycine-generating enzyme required for sulfatase activity